MNHRLTAYVLLLIVSIIWGVAGPVIKYTVYFFPPMILLTYRFFLSTLVALFVWTVAPPRHSSQLRRHFLPIFLHSVFNIPIGLGLLFFGFEKTSSLVGSVLSASGPVVTALLGLLFLHERITRRERVGTLVALLGTLFITVNPWQPTAVTDSNSSVLGNLLILASLVAGSLGAIFTKVSTREKISPFLLTNISFLIGLVTIAPVALLMYPPMEIVSSIINAPWQAHAGVWYLAFLSGTLAYTLQARGIKTVEVSEASLFAYLMPLWSAPLAILWLGETITLPFVIGAAVIATGVVIAEHKRRQKRKYR